MDAGKSTLMGHLLYKLGHVSKKTMHKCVAVMLLIHVFTLCVCDQGMKRNLLKLVRHLLHLHGSWMKQEKKGTGMHIHSCKIKWCGVYYQVCMQ